MNNTKVKSIENQTKLLALLYSLKNHLDINGITVGGDYQIIVLKEGQSLDSLIEESFKIIKKLENKDFNGMEITSKTRNYLLNIYYFDQLSSNFNKKDYKRSRSIFPIFIIDVKAFDSFIINFFNCDIDCTYLIKLLDGYIEYKIGNIKKSNNSYKGIESNFKINYQTLKIFMDISLDKKKKLNEGLTRGFIKEASHAQEIEDEYIFRTWILDNIINYHIDDVHKYIKRDEGKLIPLRDLSYEYIFEKGYESMFKHTIHKYREYYDDDGILHIEKIKGIDSDSDNDNSNGIDNDNSNCINNVKDVDNGI